MKGGSLEEEKEIRALSMSHVPRERKQGRRASPETDCGSVASDSPASRIRRSVCCLSYPGYGIVLKQLKRLGHQGNVFPLVSNVNIPFKPWTRKLTRCNTKYVQKVWLPPCKALCAWGPWGVCSGWGESPCRPRAPAICRRQVCDERRGKMLSLHIGYRAWGYKEEKNREMKGLELMWRQDICRMWVIASYRAQGHALLNFALNNIKLGCQKISARGHSSPPSFLPCGVILPSHWCNGEITGFGQCVPISSCVPRLSL